MNWGTLVYLWIGLILTEAIAIGASDLSAVNADGDAKVRKYGPTKMALAYMILCLGFWPYALYKFALLQARR